MILQSMFHQIYVRYGGLQPFMMGLTQFLASLNEDDMTVFISCRNLKY